LFVGAGDGVAKSRRQEPGLPRSLCPRLSDFNPCALHCRARARLFSLVCCLAPRALERFHRLESRA
jgi:hypothetical protein